MEKHLLILPYKGTDAMHIISSIQRLIKFFLIMYNWWFLIQVTKLKTCFTVTDKVVFNHEHDIECPEESCPYDDIGEWGRRVLEKVKDHSGRETSSHNFKHCVVADHLSVSYDDLRIVGKNYYKNKQKPKIVEAILIKNLKPPLNMQEKPVALNLFN